MPLVSEVPLGEVVFLDFITSVFSTGAASDADSTPTFEVFEEDTDTDIGVGGNATKRTSKTGNYRVSFTASSGNGFEAGKWYNVIASATVSSVAGKGVIGTFRCVAAENTAGTPVADVTRINNVAASSVTTINANVGTTQPVNFTGTGASALAKADTVDVAGSAVSTSSAQIGVNVVNAGGTAWGSGAITAASIASDAITAAKVADGTIDAATFAAGAINAAAIAADAIGASELAADAVAEIADAIWDEALSGHTTSGSAGEAQNSIDDILTDTAEIGTAGAGLTNINLPDQTMNITGDITGDLSGSVGSVTGAVGSVTGNVGGNVTGSVGSLATQAKADVNAEVVDALNTDTYAEPGQETPGATISLAKKISYLYKGFRNRHTQTDSEYDLYNDDATTVDQKATFSDDGSTADRGELATGP